MCWSLQMQLLVFMRNFCKGSFSYYNEKFRLNKRTVLHKNCKNWGYVRLELAWTMREIPKAWNPWSLEDMIMRKWIIFLWLKYKNLHNQLWARKTNKTSCTKMCNTNLQKMVLIALDMTQLEKPWPYVVLISCRWTNNSLVVFEFWWISVLLKHPWFIQKPSV